MPEEVRVSPSCPQLEQTLLLSESEPPLLTTSPALLHLGHANPSCPQACSKNSTEPPAPSAASTATGAVLEPPRPTGLLEAPQPPTAGKRGVISCAVIPWVTARSTWGASETGVQVAAWGGGKQRLPLFHLSCQKSRRARLPMGSGASVRQEGSIAKWDSQAVYQNHPEFVQGAA